MSALQRLDALLEKAKREYLESVKRNEMPPSCGLAIGTALTGVSHLVQQARAIARFESRRQEANGAGAPRG